MPGFDRGLLDAIAREQEVDLTTYGRKTGQPSRRTLWILTDGQRVYIRSGGGLRRDWPRNLLANGAGILHVAGRDVPVRARHVSDLVEARAVNTLRNRKYAPGTPEPRADDPPSPAEQATFELLPADP
jgi:deazaflavin-dependent oxidoreductase (nitroreductase family)